METTASPPITALLRAWSRGDRNALESLIPAVDRELRDIAKRCLKAKPHESILQTTALVNEAYLRLIDANQATWHDRAHFFAVCASIMRRILVDYARARMTAKRGGGSEPVSLDMDEVAVVVPEPTSDLVAIDEALEALARIDERRSRVVELRFFGGLNIDETAEVLMISRGTVRRDWRLAKAWLLKELTGGGAP